MGNESREKILAACRKHWAKYYNDCSGFVKAVAREIDADLGTSGQANDIYRAIAWGYSPNWRMVGFGESGLKEGGRLAAKGQFVIAGTAGWANGHVAVVTSFDDTWGGGIKAGRACGYWGSLNASAASTDDKGTVTSAKKGKTTWKPGDQLGKSWSMTAKEVQGGHVGWAGAKESLRSVEYVVVSVHIKG